jgi:hypothetical protein
MGLDGVEVVFVLKQVLVGGFVEVEVQLVLEHGAHLARTAGEGAFGGLDNRAQLNHVAEAVSAN